MVPAATSSSSRSGLCIAICTASDLCPHTTEQTGPLVMWVVKCVACTWYETTQISRVTLERSKCLSIRSRSSGLLREGLQCMQGGGGFRPGAEAALRICFCPSLCTARLISGPNRAVVRGPSRRCSEWCSCCSVLDSRGLFSRNAAPSAVAARLDNTVSPNCNITLEV